MPPWQVVNVRFVLSFSGGKDSILALHQMVEDGHEPVALLVMFRKEAERSWVHGLDPLLLSSISDALHIPLLCCNAMGETYEKDMERSLLRAKDMGAEACVFGDIDIEEHRCWDEMRCAAVGLKAVLPLWQRNREENARLAVNLGYRCLVKCIQSSILPETILGHPLTLAMLKELKLRGIDLCGENGEYHTVVVDGPLFRHPVHIKCRGILRLAHISAADLVVQKNNLS